LIEGEEAHGKVRVLRSPLSFTIRIGARRSWWIVFAAPLALVYTELRLMAAAESVPYTLLLIGVGLVLGLFYIVWFFWNIVGYQELVFSEGEMTISERLLRMSWSRKIAVADITGVRLREGVYRRPSCVVLDVRSRKTPYAVGENLNNADSLAVLQAIGRGIPMLAAKMQMPDVMT
jgi:hypothetical protein